MVVMINTSTNEDTFQGTEDAGRDDRHRGVRVCIIYLLDSVMVDSMMQGRSESCCRVRWPR